MPVPSPAVRYHFGPFDLYPAEGSLSRNGTRVKLQDLPYRLLLLLVERPGEIVTREEVRQRLWPKNTFVEFDNSLGVAIRKVRDCLGDDAEASPASRGGVRITQSTPIHNAPMATSAVPKRRLVGPRIELVGHEPGVDRR